MLLVLLAVVSTAAFLALGASLGVLLGLPLAVSIPAVYGLALLGFGLLGAWSE
jgi:hypothetical protein